jgi:hypothetical protein
VSEIYRGRPLEAGSIRGRAEAYLGSQPGHADSHEIGLAIGVDAKRVRAALLRSIHAGRVERITVERRVIYRLLPDEPLVVKRKGGVPARAWTLEIVRHRCEEIGECWIWQQSVQSKGYPQASINGKPGQAVRTHVYVDLMKKRKPGAGECIVAKCGNRLCVSPACLVMRTRGDVLRLQYQKGHRRPGPQSPLGCALPKLTRDQVEEIRALPPGSETKTATAKRFGVDRRTVEKILDGRSWKAAAAPASVFNWRPA